MSWFAVLIVAMIIAPYALLKAIETVQRHKSKKWSDEDADTIDNWKFPSNYM